MTRVWRFREAPGFQGLRVGNHLTKQARRQDSFPPGVQQNPVSWLHFPHFEIRQRPVYEYTAATKRIYEDFTRSRSRRR